MIFEWMALWGQGRVGEFCRQFRAELSCWLSAWIFYFHLRFITWKRKANSKLESVVRVRSSKSRWCLRFAVRDVAQAASGLDMQAQGGQGAQAQGEQGQAARGQDIQEQAYKLHVANSLKQQIHLNLWSDPFCTVIPFAFTWASSHSISGYSTSHGSFFFLSACCWIGDHWNQTAPCAIFAVYKAFFQAAVGICWTFCCRVF